MEAIAKDSDFEIPESSPRNVESVFTFDEHMWDKLNFIE